MTMSTRGRRVAPFLAAILGAALSLTACGDSDEPDGTSKDPASTGASADAFPASVDTVHGEITVPEKPKRIVVIGEDYVDMLNAMGEQPVVYGGAGDADGDVEDATPWIRDAYTGEFDAELITAEYKVDAEAVATHEPDLIIGRPFYIEDQQFKQLSAIAPTVVLDYASAERDWTDDLADLGTLTGKSEEAAEALSEVEAEFAAAREELPGLEGKTFNSGWVEGQEGIYVAGDFSWVEYLGLKPADNQPAPGEFRVTLARENIDQFAGDVVLIEADGEDRTTLEEDPRFAEWPSVKNGTLIYADRAMLNAGTAVGPSSLKWLLDELLPQLKDSALNTGGR